MFAGLEAPGFVARLNDIAVVRQAVEQRRRHLGIAEDGGPFLEVQIGGDDDRCPLVKTADQMEEQLPAGLREGQVSQLIHDDEVEPCHKFRQSALASAPGYRKLHLDLRDQGELCGPEHISVSVLSP